MLSPRELLAALLEVERELGRTREGPRFGPRTIDLDLLLYGDPDRRAGPHGAPSSPARARFALEPLAELDPELVIPGRGPVSASSRIQGSMGRDVEAPAPCVPFTSSL